jgi:hypothetical protein
MQVTRRLAGLAVAVVAAVALPITLAQPAQAACPSGTYPPDSCAPTLSLYAPASRVTIGTARPAWKAVTYGSAISYYQLRYVRAPWNGNFSAWTYPSTWQHLTSPSTALALTTGYTYCFSVRGIDTANRVGAWTANRCTAAPLDDRALALQSGWSRGTNSSYLYGTYSTTSRLNTAAVRTGAVVGQIGVVGARCSTCGTVGVYVGSTLVGKLNFASTGTQLRVPLVTGRFSPRAGTIYLRDLTSGRRLLVDGIAILRY